KTSDGKSFTFTRTNRFASDFDVSFESIFEMLRFLSQMQGQSLVDVHFSKITITASAQELFREYRIDQVLQKTGPNTFVPVSSHRPIRVKAGGSAKLRVRLLPFRDRGRVRNFDFTYRIPSNRAGSSGFFKVAGGGSNFFGFFCIFGGCGGGGGGTSTFGDLPQALCRPPRHDPLTPALVLGTARGAPGKPPLHEQVPTAKPVVNAARL